MSKRIYLVRNNETGAEELVRAQSRAAALSHVLTVRQAYEVKVATTEEAVTILKTGQQVLDPDAPPEAAHDPQEAFARTLAQAPSLEVEEAEPMSLRPPSPAEAAGLALADLDNAPF